MCVEIPFNNVHHITPMAMSSNSVLIVVDMQNDFCDPNGSLYVPGANEIIEPIKILVTNGNFDLIIFSQDWHPSNHVSFGKFPNAAVYAIEGLPDNYNTYMKNLSGITCIEAVINNYDGNTKYHVKDINGIHGIFDRGAVYGTKIIELPCYKLKTLCDTYGVTKIDMMKIDVEGATYEILLSMGDMLADVKIMHIEAETYEYFKNQTLLDEVFRFLTEKNFESIEVTYVHINSNGKQSDSVWINKKYLCS